MAEERNIMNKTQALFYRRLYVAFQISSGTDTVPKIMSETGMPRRTVQDVIKGLADFGITCEYQGATKAGCYVIKKH